MRQWNKVVMNSLLGGVIAMGVGTSGAYADDGKATATKEQATVTISANGTTTSERVPAILAGHPFYILKIIIENIEVVLKPDAVTVDDTTEKVDTAKQVTVIDTKDDATEQADTAKQVTVIDTKDASEAARSAENEANLAEAVDKDEDNVITFELRLKHNIEALMNALEHVKNPTARAALTRNIEKSLEKSLVVGELSVEVEAGHGEQAKVAKKAAHEQAKAEKKAAHEQSKAAKKAAHEQAKAAKKAAHEQAKAAKKAGH